MRGNRYVNVGERVTEIDFQCPCEAVMRGRPRKDETWVCAKNHTFKVLQDAIDVRAWAMTGDSVNGKVKKGAEYRWSGTIPVTASG